MLREAGQEITNEEAVELWQDLVSGTAFRVAAAQETHVRLMLEAGEAVAALFAGLPWQLVRFERRGLLTCDHSIGLWHHAEKQRRFGIGPVTAEEIWVPLERRTALLISAQWDDGELLEPSTRLARRINQIVVVGARRWLYHHPADTPTERLALPVAPKPDVWRAYRAPRREQLRPSFERSTTTAPAMEILTSREWSGPQSYMPAPREPMISDS